MRFIDYARVFWIPLMSPVWNLGCFYVTQMEENGEILRELLGFLIQSQISNNGASIYGQFPWFSKSRGITQEM